MDRCLSTKTFADAHRVEQTKMVQIGELDKRYIAQKDHQEAWKFKIYLLW